MMNVIWSPEILEDIELLVDYLRLEWPASVLEDFEATLLAKVDLLKSGVWEGRPASKNPAIQSVFITKQNRLYYELSAKGLLLLRLWDTRQNPTKHPYEY